MLPHRYLPGACYLLTRRCRGGRALLRPDSEVNQALLYILLRCVRKYGMKLHVHVYMSNHYHLVITDPHQELGNFLSALN